MQESLGAYSASYSAGMNGYEWMSGKGRECIENKIENRLKKTMKLCNGIVLTICEKGWGVGTVGSYKWPYDLMS